MPIETRETEQQVIQIVQALLLNIQNKSEITIEVLNQKIDLALLLDPKYKDNIDREYVLKDLIRRYSVWIGIDDVLLNEIGHIHWLTNTRKKDWKYWQRYKQWKDKKLPWDSLNALDKSTDTILELLEDPERTDAWDRRGLVVGDVQSGKTDNFTGLICKAADAGYKIIIVLAGMHNNLRSQTQMRLDEGFLGYETHPDPNKLRIIGVGDIDSGVLRPNYVTNRTEKGDFSSKMASGTGISPEQRPWLFVVKKNKSVLTRLYKWIHDHVADTTDQQTQRKIVSQLPLLIIDDEADHASVDTGEQIIDEFGVPDPEYEPKAINSLIRQILHIFSRKAYVGYTATPFANIYIHEQAETKKEGKDLFPESFIINLATPSNYIGPARVFGVKEGMNRKGQLPIIHEIEDHNVDGGLKGWMPIKHPSDYYPYIEAPFDIPSSLVDAINSFVLTCAVRQLRKQGDQHTSMLVHVTRFKLVQGYVKEQVKKYVDHISKRIIRGIDNQDILLELKYLWDNDYIPTNIKMNEQIPDLCSESLPLWSDVEQILPEIMAQINVRMINGTAKDVLDYKDRADGLKVIAIGGDKLSRGLTLEGLCISYFLRASRMYDTLMQMGRWFGYRDGYLDLCRIYTTSDLVEWFEHITDASLELREEFNLMIDSGGTPRDYGLKVQSHPTLLVTSPVKMRNGKKLLLSYSNSLNETVSFYRDKETLENNFKALNTLISKLPKPNALPLRARDASDKRKSDSSNHYYWENIPYIYVVNFLEEYITHKESYKVNNILLMNFIEKMVQDGELTSWNIVVKSGGLLNRKVNLSESITILRAERAINGRHSDRYAIRKLLSSSDEYIPLSNEEWNEALRITIENAKRNPEKYKTIPTQPSGISTRIVRGKGIENISRGRTEEGLLVIYLPEDPNNLYPHSDIPFVGFGISFPYSDSDKKVEYIVNNTEWEVNYDSSI